MFVSRIKNRYKRVQKTRLCQGDILRDITLVISAFESKRHIEIFMPYAVVMSQDCDLSNDHRARVEKKSDYDKYLKTVLICPAYRAEELFNGKHIEGWEIRSKGDGEIKKIKKNDEYKRYHFLPGNQSLAIPDLVVDFKHFYTAPRDLLYKKRKQIYLATMSELFREEISQRFSFYLSRIGLPEI